MKVRQSESNQSEEGMGEIYDLVIGESDTRTVKKTKKKPVKRRSSAWFYVGFVTEFGFVIALPLVGGAFFGSLLDRQLGTYPKATLALLFVGVVMSVVNFVRTIQVIIRR